MMKRKRTNHYL